MADQVFKTSVYEACQAQIAERLERLQQRIQHLQRDLQSESKSTAGDKHETGRAMLQLEMEKLSAQLQTTLQQQNLLVRVPYDKASKHVMSGSLLQWGANWYFISLGLGEIQVNGKIVFCLSPASPLGQSLLNKKQGEAVHFRQLDQPITELL